MPSIREYSLSVANPALCFEDEVLKAGQPENGKRNSPKQWVGQFTSVYKIRANGKAYAVRCFTSEVTGLGLRYQELKRYLIQNPVPEFVSVEYQPKGIHVFRQGRTESQCYPIVKMDWVDGETLDNFIDKNLGQPATIRHLANQWRDTARRLQGLPMAHNDLQHGNVMVRGDGAIRLVDYDGVFLPAFRGQKSPEEGHKHYQHPERSAQHYDEHSDNFPAIVIYVSLLAIAAKPELWGEFYNEKNLLFTENDFGNPVGSELFEKLKTVQDSSVAGLAGKLAGWCANPIEKVPTLDDFLKLAPPKAAGRSRLPARRQTYRERLTSESASAKKPEAIKSFAELRAAFPKAQNAPAPEPVTQNVAKPVSSPDVKRLVNPPVLTERLFLEFCVNQERAQFNGLDANKNSAFRLTALLSDVISVKDDNSVAVRELKLNETIRFIKFFQESQSWNPSDYWDPSGIAENKASNYLAILRDLLILCETNSPGSPAAELAKSMPDWIRWGASQSPSNRGSSSSLGTRRRRPY